MTLTVAMSLLDQGMVCKMLLMIHCVDTLVAETNDSCVRWMNGCDEMQFSSSKTLVGELQECLLPLKGHFVQELKKFKMEQEEGEVKTK